MKKLLVVINKINKGVCANDIIENHDTYLPEFEIPILSMSRILNHKIDEFSKLSTEMNHSAGELSIAANELDKNTSEQSESTNSTAAVINEMGQSIEEVTSRIQEASDAAKLATTLSQSGNHAIITARKEVDQVSTFARETQSLVNELAEKSENVTSMSKVIEDIAAQTNLLALNAAIEAARAGEHGRGFAVVADEVRSLANRSYSSAIAISENIFSVNERMQGVIISMDQVISKVETCIDHTKLAEDTLDNIAKKNQSVSEEISAIAVAADQQTISARDMALYIERVALSAEENSRMAGQTASISNHLLKLAQPVTEQSL